MNVKETTMKRTTIAKTFAITVATALALGIAPKAKADGRGCSNATLQGTFAYTSTGFNTAASPAGAGTFAEVGTQTFDGKGGAPSGAATISHNGTIYLGVSINGTYTVNSNCTGTLMLQAALPGVGVVPFERFFVIDGIGTEFQAIELGVGTVITSIYRRILLLP